MAALDALLRTMLDKAAPTCTSPSAFRPRRAFPARSRPSATSRSTPPRCGAPPGNLPEHRWADFMERHDLDLAHEIPDVARFRGNFLYNHWAWRRSSARSRRRFSRSTP